MKKKWETDDTCPGCCSDGMVFYHSRSIPHGSGIGEIHIGRLSCPVCGWDDACSYCYDYMVPRLGDAEGPIDCGGAEDHKKGGCYTIKSQSCLSPQGRGLGHKNKTYYWVDADGGRVSRLFESFIEAEKLANYLKELEA